MAAEVVAAIPFARIAAFVEEQTGLHFPEGRHDDLRRGIEEAARGQRADVRDFMAELISRNPGALRALIPHLTIGETYFFRDPRTLQALRTHVLPEIIARRADERTIRVWSAACCTGEEAYSLAMLLLQALPDARSWRIVIVATDINEAYLEKAAAASYGSWSFRDGRADEYHAFFDNDNGRRVVRPEVRGCVRFLNHNLTHDMAPVRIAAGGRLDLIVCRNVLMYFAQPTARIIGERLAGCLADEGWLVLGPSEGSKALLPRFAPMMVAGSILYRKAEARPTTVPPGSTEAFFIAPEVPNAASAAVADKSAEEHFAAGRYREAVESLLVGQPARPVSSSSLGLLVRALANQGLHAKALHWSSRWIAQEPMNGTARYLHASILQEQGRGGEARSELRAALYLDPEFALAHFALGNIARAEGQGDEAARHFANALQSLRRYPTDVELEFTNGLLPAHLATLIETLTGEREKG